MNIPLVIETKKRLTAAELKSWRESLGLTVQWVADAVKVTLRTAQYWEAERMSMPSEVYNKLTEMDNLLHKAKQALYEYAERFEKKFGAHIAIPLARYRTEEELWSFQPETHELPLTIYNVCLAQVQENLKTKDKRCLIGFFDKEKYKKWLKDEKKTDSELERAEWISFYYGNISRKLWEYNAVFTEFSKLSNNEKKFLWDNLSAEEYCTIIDEIASFETSDDPKLLLLAFYLRCAKYSLFKEESDRSGALTLSKSLWALGNSVEEQLHFSDFLKAIIKLCHLRKTDYKEGDFSKHFLIPINNYFSENNNLCKENLLKILGIITLLICIEEYPEKLNLKHDEYDLRQITSAIHKKISCVYGTKDKATNIWINFLKKHNLHDERIEQIINDLNPQFLAERAAKNMKWHRIRYEFQNMPNINKGSLMQYLQSCKECILMFIAARNNSDVIIESTSKVYIQKDNSLVLGNNTDNFYWFLSNQLLNKLFATIDLSLNMEKQNTFQKELDSISLDETFLNAEQTFFLKRGLIQGLIGHYMEAAFLLMPYIENLIRIQAVKEGWNAIDHNGDKKTPNKAAVEYFLRNITSLEKKQLLQTLYTIMWDVPNQDDFQTKRGRIGGDLRVLSFHGLMNDQKIFDSITQAKYTLIWIITAILVLDNTDKVSS